MAISDRITSIEEHIKESYQELEGIGIDTTGVNNNLENIPKLIDGYWETLPKVTGEGTSITLDNTKEGKMKINLKGNTYQEGTPTPETPQDIHVVSGDNSIVVCGKNLFHFESQRNTGWYSDVPNMIKEIGAYTLSINDTSLSGVWAVWFADNNGDRIGNFIKPSSSVSTPSTFNVTQEQANAPYIRILPNASGLHDIQNYKIQIEKGNTATTYEPYQSQSYPVNLGVENLWKNQLNGFIPVTGSYPTINSTYPNSRYIVVKLLKGHSLTLSGSTDNYGRCRYIDIDTNQSVGTITSSVVNDYYTSTGDFSNGFVEGTITAKKDFIVGIMDLRSTANSLVVNYGGKQTISDNPIELCKIGDYQDKLFRTSGKNLFSGDYSQFDSTGGEGTTYGYFKLPDDGERYTLSVIAKKDFTATLSQYIGFTKKGGTATGGFWWLIQGNQTYTKGQKYTIHNSQQGIRLDYVSIYANNSTTLEQLMDNFYIQLEKSSEATDYEPYGNGDWYLEKKIGKVVLDSSESWTKSSNTNVNRYYIPGTFINTILNVNTIDLISDFFTCITPTQSDAYNVGLSKLNNTSIMANFSLSDTSFDTLQKFKTWLGTHNTIVYYVLATPTYTEITNSTLLSQLNALAKSYNSQTNISQENNDLASLLNATALSE